jgi:hypothetical protein
MGSAPEVRLVLALDSTDGDADAIDAEARRLRRELSELDVESVSLATGGDVPEGAKAADVAALGTLLVTTLPAVLPKLLELVQGWVQRRDGRTVKIHATAGDRTFDVEYSPRSMSQSDLAELVASVSRALDASHGTT